MPLAIGMLRFCVLSCGEGAPAKKECTESKAITICLDTVDLPVFRAAKVGIRCDVRVDGWLSSYSGDF